MSSPFVMITLVEATSVLRRPLQRFCNVDFTGLPCLEMLTYCKSCDRCQKLGAYDMNSTNIVMKPDNNDGLKPQDRVDKIC
jgi:hypothetical protein